MARTRRNAVYVPLLQWAVAGTLTIGTAVVLDETLEAVANSISTRVPADHRRPAPTEPEQRPREDNPPKPLPEDPQPEPDERDRQCRSGKRGPNEVEYLPTTTFGPDQDEVATGAVALIAATGGTDPTAQGDKPAHDPVGWRPGNEVHRGHLIARDFGGDGQVHNIVAQFQSTNLRTYANAEEAVRTEVNKRCNPVLLDVTVAYHDGTESVDALWAKDRLPADSFRFDAVSDTGPVYAASILNRR